MCEIHSHGIYDLHTGVLSLVICHAGISYILKWSDFHTYSSVRIADSFFLMNKGNITPNLTKKESKVKQYLKENELVQIKHGCKLSDSVHFDLLFTSAINHFKFPI